MAGEQTGPASYVERFLAGESIAGIAEAEGLPLEFVEDVVRVGLRPRDGVTEPICTCGGWSAEQEPCGKPGCPDCECPACAP